MKNYLALTHNALNIIRIILTSFILIIFYNSGETQIFTYEIVYNLFSQNCNSSGCHNNIDKAASLDLEGDGVNDFQRKIDVYNNIYSQLANVDTSSQKEKYLIFPGDPYRSYLFRKINNGLAENISLDPDEGDVMPPPGQNPLDNKEIELIRQWILFGAPLNKKIIDPNLIIDYYDNNGLNPLTYVPAPPLPDEGFQIHIGPFFIKASQPEIVEEKEYYTKYIDFLDEKMEITEIETHMGNFSHHAIINKFIGDNSKNVEFGFRNQYKYEKSQFVSGTQYSNSWKLPEGTAFIWDENTDLDLNVHFVNYSHDKVVACETYFNVYTQEKGAAERIMNSKIYSYRDLFIPNDGKVHTFDEVIYAKNNYPVEIWAIQGHTHSLGKDFHVYTMSEDYSRGKQIYDGGCPQGIPGCEFEYFDFEHIPTVTYEPYIILPPKSGLFYDASYENNTISPVEFGLRSTDEMMLFILYYLIDSSYQPIALPPPIDSIDDFSGNLNIFPNPLRDKFEIELEEEVTGNVTVSICDLSGNYIYIFTGEVEKEVFYHTVDLREELVAPGLYLLYVYNDGKLINESKIILN